jgi:alkanesulfonate monooxygenase SsuD/methylene tetrahydromethanopterin reductase-like flavin-dependent oxidoreductase (luciferase family)
LGYDSLWIADHLFGIPGPGDDPFLECWTLLTAMAVETQRMRLGTMTTCSGFRSPALLAKMAATVDVISGGRLEIGIGSAGTSESLSITAILFLKPQFAPNS